MKRNLLKQSVIAVLVGGAVSNYAAATATNNNDVKKRLDEIDTYIDNILDESEAYEAEVDAKLDQHSAVLGRHTTRLNNLKTIAEKARDDSSEALDKIKALEEQNDEFLADITTLEERVDKNSSRITKAETEVSLLKNRVDGAAGALNLLSQNIGLNKTNIEKKADKTEVDANKAAIATNKAEIATNKTAIATNKADIATHTQRLDNLDNRVNNLNKDLKRGLASQAALNGLFQPYNVGKLNLTAAVGGYKSQTAVAVGTGYRHNENVATKAGIAFTHGGSATYNVGVNFEW